VCSERASWWPFSSDNKVANFSKKKCDRNTNRTAESSYTVIREIFD